MTHPLRSVSVVARIWDKPTAVRFDNLDSSTTGLRLGCFPVGLSHVFVAITLRRDVARPNDSSTSIGFGRSEDLGKIIKHSRRAILRIAESVEPLWSRLIGRIEAWCLPASFSQPAAKRRSWDVTKTEPLQVWKHDESVSGAAFTGDEARVLSWSDDGAVKLWDVKLGDQDLTPAERILGLEVRSASRPGVSGQLTKLSFAEWTALVRSDEYAAMQKRKSSNGPGTSK